MKIARFLVAMSLFLIVISSCVTDESDLVLDDEGQTNDTVSEQSDDANQELCGNKTVDEGEICDSGAKECSEIDSKYSGGIAT